MQLHFLLREETISLITRDFLHMNDLHLLTFVFFLFSNNKRMKPVSHNLLACGFLKSSVCGRVPVEGRDNERFHRDKNTNNKLIYIVWIIVSVVT